MRCKNRNSTSFPGTSYFLSACLQVGGMDAGVCKSTFTGLRRALIGSAILKEEDVWRYKAVYVADISLPPKESGGSLLSFRIIPEST